MKAVKWLLWIAGGCVALAIVAVAGTFIVYKVWEGDHIERLAIQSRVINTAAGEIEYATIGEGRARLMVHGTPGGFDQMLVQAKVRPDSVANEQLIAVSRPGYLRTPITSGRAPAEQADLYAALLDELGVDKTVVYGGSGGAPSALRFALRHPERTIALVLIVPLLTDLEGEPMASQVSDLEMMQTDLSTWLTTLLPVADFIPGADPGNPAQAEAIELLIATTLPTRLRRPGQHNDSIEFRSLDMDSWPLEELAVPTLLVHGDADANAPYEGSVRASERIPDARLVTFEDGGHFIVVTEAQAISEHVSHFLDNVERPTEGSE